MGDAYEASPGEHPPTLDENVPPFLLVSQILADYGWFILIGLIVAYYFWNKALSKITVFQLSRQSAAHHKDPDVFLAQEQALQRARQKLQEKYEQEAKLHQERLKKEKELKDEKRKDVMQSASAEAKSKSERKSFKPEFNPLMGGGSTSCYRPARRGGGGG